MSNEPGSGWAKEGDDLFIHTSGARIAKTTYQQKEGWFLMPVDLDAPVLEFPPTEEGRAQAFETFSKGLPARKKVKVKVKADREKEPPRGREDDEEPSRGEEGGAGGLSPEEVEADEDEDEDEDEDDGKESEGEA